MTSPDQVGLSEPRLFTGTLSHVDNSLAIAIRIHIDATGEVVFDFDPIPLTNESKFLLFDWFQEGDPPTRLLFAGVAEDETTFRTDGLHLSKCSHRSDETGQWLDIAANCLISTFRRPVKNPTPSPVLALRLRGFSTFRGHRADCILGTVTLEAHRPNGDRNALTGTLRVHAARVPEDLVAWRAEAAPQREQVGRVN
jgi:hypothetical protein